MTPDEKSIATTALVLGLILVLVDDVLPGVVARRWTGRGGPDDHTATVATAWDGHGLLAIDSEVIGCQSESSENVARAGECPPTRSMWADPPSGGTHLDRRIITNSRTGGNFVCRTLPHAYAIHLITPGHDG